jgi:hypothetical protein
MKKYSLFIIFFLTGSRLLAQQAAIDTLSGKFNAYRVKNFQEKIYLHISQSSFLTGETIRFSAYIVDASLHKPSDLSKVAYVEVIDRASGPVARAKIELKNGRGNGSIYLSPSITTGNYIIRAYTQWMKNTSPEFYFHKALTIVNTFTPIDLPQKQILENPYEAAFFPEGGNLLADVSGKVAFRVVSKNGKGISFTGCVLNGQNDTILHFAPQHFGIGNFTFTPAAGVIYKAVIKDQEGKSFRYDLPQVVSNGYALHVKDSADQFYITINYNIENASGPMFLFAHTRNQVSHAEVILQQNRPFIIDKKNLPDGISQITLFDFYLRPVSERLVFKQPERALSIVVQPNQSEYGIRRPVEIDIQTIGIQTDVPASLSVSVFKKDSLAATNSQSIFNYLYLSSDLHGEIESPEFYLSAPSTTINQAVDNLMLTHGWRRFKWDDVLNRQNSAVKFLPEYHGHLISAVLENQDGSPASDIMTYLASPSKAPRVYHARSNDKGYVQFDVQNFYGLCKIVAQTNFKKDSTYHFTINDPFSDQYDTRHVPPLEITSSLQDQLTERNFAMQVEDVYHRNKEKYIYPVSDTLAFYGNANEIYRLDDFTRFPVMEEVMREYVSGVLVRKKKDGFRFVVVDNYNESVFEGTPFMLIDGVPFFDEDEIMHFDPLKIKRLDVMTRHYYSGLLDISGMVSFITYKGDLAGFKINPHALVLNYEGLQLQREFYAPQYETQKARESRLPDQRHLLYWNPAVQTSGGKVQLTFYTSDVPGDYSIVVEGLRKDGTPGSAIETFKVKTLNN